MSGSTIIRKAVALAVIASFMSLTTACYGPFNLTRNVYHWNSEIKGSGKFYGEEEVMRCLGAAV